MHKSFTSEFTLLWPEPRVVPKFYPISLSLFFFPRSFLSSSTTSANRFHSFLFLSLSSFFFSSRFSPLPVFDFNPRSEEEIVARVLNALRTWHPRCCAVWARAPLTTPFPLFPPFSAFVRSFSFFSRPLRASPSFLLYTPRFILQLFPSRFSLRLPL